MIRSLIKRLNLAITLVLFVFAVMLISFVVVGILTVFLHRIGMFDSLGLLRGNPLFPILGLLLICTLLGTALTAFFSRKALNPIRKVIAATHQVARGNFNVQVNIKGIGELEDLSQSFNKMTHELSGIETLRSDFVNNFSHEFKTPIVSMRGFAKLLKEGDLSEEERREYLDIIISESERLSELSTNILSLSKYETIQIITDKALFRLDEQIRRAVLMTEPKWSAKGIFVNVGLDEITFNGNEDLTQQIWLNLLDNAIKYSYEGGGIGVSLIDSGDVVRFSVQNDGPGMDEEVRTHIFDKFYQGDTSHGKTGNGLGLTMVERIVDLCGGSVEVHSEIEKGSVFVVTLPNEKER